MIRLITLQSEFPSLKSEMIIVHSLGVIPVIFSVIGIGIILARKF